LGETFEKEKRKGENMKEKQRKRKELRQWEVKG
jgi:hypothetical protein